MNICVDVNYHFPILQDAMLYLDMININYNWRIRHNLNVTQLTIVVCATILIFRQRDSKNVTSKNSSRTDDGVSSVVIFVQSDLVR